MGFFSESETKSDSHSGGKAHSCASCGLYRNVNSPKMKPYGKGKKGILNIGEAPGEAEDELGKPWQGKTGKLLKQVYRNLGIDLFEDCVNINSCHCRPMDREGNNRAPTPAEVDNCRRTTLQWVKEIKPRLIVLLGGSAVRAFLGNRMTQDLRGISTWRGFQIPDQDFKTWVAPTFHPSYVEREKERKEVETIWVQDLERAFELLNKDLPITPEPDIQYITDLSVLTKFGKHSEFMAFDYETTGLKPHAPGHRIVSASVAFSPDQVYSFLMPKTKAERRPLLELLQELTPAKMAHNIKFEDTWTRVRLKTQVNNWAWDSMQAAHLLDNRKYVTGLKFQTYVNFGVVDFSGDVSQYLRPRENSGNAFNRIDDLLHNPEGEHILLKYGGFDSYYQYLLSMKQIKELGYDFLPF